MRKSPSQSATLYKVGTKKKGNDGNTWVIVVNKNNVKRWVLSTNNRSKKNNTSNLIQIKKINDISINHTYLDQNNQKLFFDIDNKQIILETKSKYYPFANNQIITIPIDNNEYLTTLSRDNENFFSIQYTPSFDLTIIFDFYLTGLKKDEKENIIKLLKDLPQPYWDAWAGPVYTQIKYHYYGHIVLLTPDIIKTLKDNEKYYITTLDTSDTKNPGNLMVLEFHGINKYNDILGQIYKQDGTIETKVLPFLEDYRKRFYTFTNSNYIENSVFVVKSFNNDTFKIPKRLPKAILYDKFDVISKLIE